MVVFRCRLARARDRLRSHCVARVEIAGSFGWNPGSGEIFWSDETFRIFDYEPRSKPSIEMMRIRLAKGRCPELMM